LLAVETARALVAGAEGPPPNLRAAVDAILGRLPHEVGEAVALLAVAGRPLRSAELRRLGGAAAGGVVDEAEGLLVRRGGRLGFRHDLLRAAVLAGIDDPPALHDRLASAIEPDDPAELAHHLAAAGRAEDAAAAWATAATRARAVGALDEAAELMQRAVRCVPGDGLRWIELHELWMWQGRDDEAEAAWATALPLVPAAERAAAWCRRARLHRTVECRPAEARRSYRAAERAIGSSTDRATRAEVLIGLAWSDAVAGAGEEFESLLEAAEQMLPDASPRDRADILETRMQGLIRQGRFAEAAALVDVDATAGDTVLPERTYGVLVNAVCALICIGRDEDALAIVDRALGITEELGVLAVENLCCRALLLARLGRHEEAAEEVARARQRCERLDVPRTTATVAHDAGLVALRAGRFADAAGLFGEALARPADVSRVATAMLRAEALAAAGDADAAERQLRAAVTEATGPADQPWALVPRLAWVQALIAESRGDHAAAVRRLDEAAQGWTRLRSVAASAAGASYVASLVDLGRPPIVGLVEPDRELARVAEARARLTLSVVP
jgi:tetratricopeptide (TPR) repeat protein